MKFQSTFPELPFFMSISFAAFDIAMIFVLLILPPEFLVITVASFHDMENFLISVLALTGVTIFSLSTIYALWLDLLSAGSIGMCITDKSFMVSLKNGKTMRLDKVVSTDVYRMRIFLNYANYVKIDSHVVEISDSDLAKIEKPLAQKGLKRKSQFNLPLLVMKKSFGR